MQGTLIREPATRYPGHRLRKSRPQRHDQTGSLHDCSAAQLRPERYFGRYDRCSVIRTLQRTVPVGQIENLMNAITAGLLRVGIGPTDLTVETDNYRRQYVAQRGGFGRMAGCAPIMCACGCKCRAESSYGEELPLTSLCRIVEVGAIALCRNVPFIVSRAGCRSSAGRRLGYSQN